jgi:hypothetical protein
MNYPEDIRNYDSDSRSPYHVEPEYTDDDEAATEILERVWINNGYKLTKAIELIWLGNDLVEGAARIRDLMNEASK